MNALDVYQKNLTPSGVFLTFQWHTRRQNFLPCFIFMSHPSQQILVPEKKKFSYKDHLLSIISLKRAHTILSFCEYCCNLQVQYKFAYFAHRPFVDLQPFHFLADTLDEQLGKATKKTFFIKEIDGSTSAECNIKRNELIPLQQKCNSFRWKTKNDAFSENIL